MLFFFLINRLTPGFSPSLRYFFAVLAILTVLGILNGLVLLPVLLSMLGPPAEATEDDDAHRPSIPSPEPLLPPPMTHHGHYKSHHGPPPPSSQPAFSELSHSEYSGGTTTSGIGDDYNYCDSNEYGVSCTAGSPPTSEILLEASKNPSFPKMKVSCCRILLDLLFLCSVKRKR